MSADMKMWGKHKDVVRHLLLMLCATAVLLLLSNALLQAPCWSLFFLVAIIAWPIWHYQRERALFHRRAILSGVALEESWVRRWFWSGHITSLLQVGVALFWATLLLTFGYLLEREQWLVLLADIPAIMLIIGLLNRRLSGQVRGWQLGTVVRQWPMLWMNIAILSISFFIIDFLLGAPDTRLLTWNAVAEKAFSEVNAAAICSVAGWLVGIINVLNHLTWHALQIFIPGLPDKTFKLFFWVVVLLKSGVVAYAYTRFQLGIVSLIEHRGLHQTGLKGMSAFSKGFFLTIIVLAVPYLYAIYKLQNLDLETVKRIPEKLAELTNPCTRTKQAGDMLKSVLDMELLSVSNTTKQQVSDNVDKELAVLFANVEQGVDRYLDWYFSVIGEYQRLGTAVVGDLPVMMNVQLEQHLFQDGKFGDRLEQASKAIAENSEMQMSELANRLGAQIRSSVSANRCEFDALDLSALVNLERDRLRAATAAGSGVAAVAGAKLLAKKTSAAIAGKIASKKVFQAAAGLAGKVLAKKSASILIAMGTGTAACAPTGPFALLCGAVAGGVTWFAVDKAFIKIDEVRFREEMRAEILAGIAMQQAEISSGLKALHYTTIDNEMLKIKNAVNRIFVPVRDGL